MPDSAQPLPDPAPAATASPAPDAGQRLEFYASAAPGTESAVRDELAELGFRSTRLNRGGIPFLGPWSEGWRACLLSRTAQRIMAVTSRFEAASAEALYEGVRGIDWLRYVTPRQTLGVSAFVTSSALTHSGFAALRVKDAIVDQIRDRCGNRPDVDRESPDLRVFLYLARNRATVYADLSGDALFLRGYRTTAGEAPLKETLAAVVLRLAGWDRCLPLLDPMCGSGTFCIEAALWAGNVAPGLFRSRFGFQRWACFDPSSAQQFEAMKGELRQRGHGQHPGITGLDSNPEAVLRARENARSAGVRLGFRVGDLRDLRPDGSRRFLVTNPPYGVRLAADDRFHQEMAATFRRLDGWHIGVLTGNPRFRAMMGRAPTQCHALFNGDLPCELLVYERT